MRFEQSIHPCPAPRCQDENGGGAVLTLRPMCDNHTGRVGKVIRELPRYYRELSEILLPEQRPPSDDVKVKTSKTKPLPINGDARAAQEDMLRLLRTAETAYRRHRHWRFTPLPIGEYALVTHFAAFAQTHLDGMLRFDVTFGVELLELNQRIRYLLGLTSATQRLPLPCQECGNTQLIRVNGTEHALCRVCDSTFGRAEYDELAADRGLATMLVDE